MLAKAACQNVEAINADFLTIDPSHPKYSLATHMYVLLRIPLISTHFY
jgi:putative methyltransferase